MEAEGRVTVHEVGKGLALWRRAEDEHEPRVVAARTEHEQHAAEQRRVTIAPIASSGKRMIRTIRLASAFLDANRRLKTMVGEDGHRPEDVAHFATDRPARTVPVQPLRPQHEWPQDRIGRDGDHSDP